MYVRSKHLRACWPHSSEEEDFIPLPGFNEKEEARGNVDTILEDVCVCAREGQRRGEFLVKPLGYDSLWQSVEKSELPRGPIVLEWRERGRAFWGDGWVVRTWTEENRKTDRLWQAGLPVRSRSVSCCMTLDGGNGL